MRENRTYGSEGGGTGTTGPSYPYPAKKGGLYLDTLDHFVKRQLKVRCYQRYMDDMAQLLPDGFPVVLELCAPTAGSS